MTRIILMTAASALMLGACTTTGNTERNAAIGAGLGALTGAVIGNNVGSGDGETGAIIGGVIGAAGGAYTGRQQDQNMGERTQIRRGANGEPLEYDSYAGRYYFRDTATNRTYWQNGQLRTR
ncbi:glycine zipper domain-containing protein [Fretibacter rubidus]|uniref:glycine zipper domain-containing protein n=1 Tax=Fretibacter rubidus TaxID=570162 RepID=UPI00352AA31F